MTVPNQSLTLSELLRRHIAGTAPSSAQQPLYDEDVDYDSADYTKINTLDLSEKDEIRMALKNNINQMKESLKPKPKPPAMNERPEPTEEPVTIKAKKAKPKTEGEDED